MLLKRPWIEVLLCHQAVKLATGGLKYFLLKKMMKTTKMNLHKIPTGKVCQDSFSKDSLYSLSFQLRVREPESQRRPATQRVHTKLKTLDCMVCSLIHTTIYIIANIALSTRHISCHHCPVYRWNTRSWNYYSTLE